MGKEGALTASEDTGSVFSTLRRARRKGGKEERRKGGREGRRRWREEDGEIGSAGEKAKASWPVQGAGTVTFPIKVTPLITDKLFLVLNSTICFVSVIEGRASIGRSW